MIALRTGETEESLFEDGVLLVVKREREAESRLTITDAEQAVLSPPVRAAPRLIVREVLPAGAELGVVLAHRPPLALGEIRPQRFQFFSRLSSSASLTRSDVPSSRDSILGPCAALYRRGSRLVRSLVPGWSKRLGRELEEEQVQGGNGKG